MNQRLKSVVREIRTLRSVGTGGGRLPPVTRWEARAFPTPILLHHPVRHAKIPQFFFKRSLDQCIEQHNVNCLTGIDIALFMS